MAARTASTPYAASYLPRVRLCCRAHAGRSRLIKPNRRWWHVAKPHALLSPLIISPTWPLPPSVLFYQTALEHMPCNAPNALYYLYLTMAQDGSGRKRAHQHQLLAMGREDDLLAPPLTRGASAPNRASLTLKRCA